MPLPAPDSLTETLTDVAGQLAPRSRAIYTSDAGHFARWLADAGLSLESLSRSDVIRYRQHLEDSYAKVTAARMLTVARRLCVEAVRRGVLTTNPTDDVRGFKGIAQETTHRALDKDEAHDLLAGIDRATRLGQRDYALMVLLLRTGMRRSEAAGLVIGDLTTEQGHHIATIRHGKGDKRRIVKLANEVRWIIGEYLTALGRADAGPAAPLFVAFDKGDRPSERPMRAADITRVVTGRAKAANLDGLSPHGLRATFITLALEGGAKLQQVQYFAGHSSPVTTERYQKRKLNLNDSAADYVRVL